MRKTECLDQQIAEVTVKLRESEAAADDGVRDAVVTIKKYSGADADESKCEVRYGREWAFRRGETAGEKQLARLKKVLEKKEFEITVDLGLGDGESTIFTCDLSLDYVHINADYTT
mgnify:CR=1 FL=1